MILLVFVVESLLLLVVDVEGDGGAKAATHGQDVTP
jgi:hypothetical protein